MTVREALTPILAAASILGAGAGHAQAPIAYKCHCFDTGAAAQEALGDRAGHALSISSFACRVEGGPMDGGIMTGSNIWEWDKASGTLLSGDGVGRKPGMAAVYQIGEGKIALTMADGKPTGFRSSGKGSFKLVTGAAAALAGKAFTWSAMSSAPGQFTIDVKVD